MAKLTSKQRSALAPGVFALPGRKYPINDRAHAANAKARATQQYNGGNLTASEKATVDRKANKKLGKGTKRANGVKLGTHMHESGASGFSQHSNM